MEVDANMMPTCPPFWASHQDQSRAAIPAEWNEFPAFMKNPLIPPAGLSDDAAIAYSEREKEQVYGMNYLMHFQSKIVVRRGGLELG